MMGTRYSDLDHDRMNASLRGYLLRLGFLSRLFCVG
jgi:hypothetical protein